MTKPQILEQLGILGKAVLILGAVFLAGAGVRVGGAVMEMASLDATSSKPTDLSVVIQRLGAIESATDQNRREICLLRLEVRKQTNTEECTR